MHKDDKKWFADQIGKLEDPKHKLRAADGYRKVYADAFAAEPVEHKKENKARFAANTRLRIFVKKILANALYRG